MVALVQRPTFTVEQSLGKGICQGDSGGPGMFEIEGKTYIVGIVSSVIYRETSSTADRCRFKGQYINVQYYLDWIAQESAKLLYVGSIPTRASNNLKKP